MFASLRRACCGIRWASDSRVALRDFCGVLLRSHQFLLAGLPPLDHDDGAPGICVDDRCTVVDHCEHYGATAESLGYPPVLCAEVYIDDGDKTK